MRNARNVIQVLFLSLFFIIILNGNMILWLGIFVVSLVSAFVFGRFYCGYICPMHTVMGITGKLSKKLNWQSKKVPKVLKTRALPWIVLAIMLITMVLSKMVLHREVPVLIILMILSVLVTLRFEEWVFHNHICPYGALLSITGKHAKFNTEVNQSLCIGCKKCEKVCPSQAIKVNTETKKASTNPTVCHQCQSCILICPEDAIHYRKTI